MSQTLTINNVAYTFPTPGDRNWGGQVSAWAAAISSATLQKSGGTFTLTAEVDFGAAAGLKSAYFKSRTASAATAGAVRLARTDSVAFRNAADSADLLLTVDGSNVLTFNGSALGYISSVSDSSTIDLTNTAGALSASVIAASLSNSHVAADAGISFSKMEALTASRALVSSAGGVVSVVATTAIELGYVSGVTSAIQTQLNARLPLAGGTMTGALTLSGAPTSDLHAATKAYVDAAIMGLSVRDSVRVATATAGTLASDFEDGDTVDDVELATGDRILIKNQAAPAANGIYVVAASGAPTRATDADAWDELVQAFVFVEEGTANAGTSWVSQTAAGGTLGVTAVTFGQFGGAASYTADGSGLELSGTTFALELDGTTLSKSASGLKVNEIANAQIAAAAAITRTKLAAGTAYRLMINDATGAVGEAAALTANRVLLSDANGIPTASSVSNTVLGYLDATSSIQTQLDARLAKAGGTMAGTLNMGTNAITNGGAATFSSLTVSGVAALGASSTVDGEEIATTDSVVWANAISAEVSGAAADEIDITDIPAYDVYEVLLDVSLNNASGTETIFLNFNNDSGADQYSLTTIGTSTSSDTEITVTSFAQSATTRYSIKLLITNPETSFKTAVREYATVAYDDILAQLSAISSQILLGWMNDSDRISRMTFSTGNAAKFQIGSKIKIIGMNF